MTNLDRFKLAGMILGGCPLDEHEKPVESTGWVGRFAEAIGVDRGNLGKVLAGQRKLSTDLEDRLDRSIREWRDHEVKRIRIALLIAAQIDAERQAQNISAEFDGPTPLTGG